MALRTYAGGVTLDRYDDVPYFMGSSDEKRAAVTMHELEAVGIKDVCLLSCRRINPGSVGCWQCHKIGARAALESKSDVYILFEDNVRPSLRFDITLVRAAVDALRRRPSWKRIELATFHFVWDGITRMHTGHPHVYRRIATKGNGTSAYVATAQFARELLAREDETTIPIDHWTDKWSMVVYPAPFVRATAAQVPTFIDTGKFMRIARNVCLTPWVNAVIEYLTHHLSQLIVLFIIVVIRKNRLGVHKHR